MAPGWALSRTNPAFARTGRETQFERFPESRDPIRATAGELRKGLWIARRAMSLRGSSWAQVDSDQGDSGQMPGSPSATRPTLTYRSKRSSSPRAMSVHRSTYRACLEDLARSENSRLVTRRLPDQRGFQVTIIPRLVTRLFQAGQVSKTLAAHCGAMSANRRRRSRVFRCALCVCAHSSMSPGQPVRAS